MSKTVAQYIELLERYTDRELASCEFEGAFLSFYRSEPAEAALPLHVSTIIDNLFYDVDAYCEDPSLRNEDSIDEEELQRRCKVALGKLRVASCV